MTTQTAISHRVDIGLDWDDLHAQLDERGFAVTPTLLDAGEYDWAALIGGPTSPATHDELLELCRTAGQERPTPLILRYGPGDRNALHRDLYGDASSRSRSLRDAS